MIEKYLFIAGMLVVFYFFMVRPKIKKQEEQQKMLNKLKKGDKILTSGGIIGSICDIDSVVIVLEIDNRGSKITILKDSVVSLYNRDNN